MFLLLFSIAGVLLGCSQVEIDIEELEETSSIRVIAHRGYWKEGGSQNSLDSIRGAAQLGVDGIEFDVRVTQDDSVIVVHDASVEGLAIAQTTFSRLRELRLSNGEQIPTLYEFLKVASEYPNLELFIELKTTSSIPKILDIVESAQLQNHVVYISFMESALKAVLDRQPIAELGYIRQTGQGNWDIQELQNRYTYIVYQLDILTSNPQIVEEAKKEGVCIVPFMIDDYNSYNMVTNMGLDYILSNNPELWINGKM